MRSKLYIIMPVLLLLALLAYPVLQIFYEAEENPYLVEIVETSTNRSADGDYAVGKTARSLK